MCRELPSFSRGCWYLMIGIQSKQIVSSNFSLITPIILKNIQRQRAQLHNYEGEGACNAFFNRETIRVPSISGSMHATLNLGHKFCELIDRQMTITFFRSHLFASTSSKRNGGKDQARTQRDNATLGTETEGRQRRALEGPESSFGPPKSNRMAGPPLASGQEGRRAPVKNSFTQVIPHGRRRRRENRVGGC